MSPKGWRYVLLLTLVTSSAGASMVGTIAGIVATFGSAAAPIVLPIAGCIVLARWVYEVYQKS